MLSKGQKNMICQQAVILYPQELKSTSKVLILGFFAIVNNSNFICG